MWCGLEMILPSKTEDMDTLVPEMIRLRLSLKNLSLTVLARDPSDSSDMTVLTSLAPVVRHIRLSICTHA